MLHTGCMIAKYKLCIHVAFGFEMVVVIHHNTIEVSDTLNYIDVCTSCTCLVLKYMLLNYYNGPCSYMMEVIIYV